MDSPTTGTSTSEPRSSITGFITKRSALLSEIEVSVSVTSDLKTHLNTLTNIGQLPDEVLAKILVAHARDHHHSITRDKPHTWKPPRWIKLAHVCRHWREVAFGTPRFWGYLHVQRPRTFSVLLPLSKASPLYLDLNLGQCDWVDTGAWIPATQLISQASCRLRELHCVATPEQFKALSEKLAYCPMGFLQKLVLSRYTGQTGGDSRPFHLLTVPGSRQAPRLRHLELREFPILWTDPIFSSALTTLVVTVTASRKAVPYTGTFDQLMDALKAMAPSLVRLTLEECIPRLQSCASEPPHPTHFILLDSLRSLRIVANTNDCARMMANLHVNPAAKVDLTVHGATGVQRLVQLLSSHVSRSSPLLAVRISFSFATSRPSVTLTGYKSANPLLVHVSDPHISVSLSTSWRPGSARQPPLTALLKAASTSKLFECVETLRVSTHDANSNLKYYAIDWPALFLRTPVLEILDVAGHPDKGFFKALSGCDTQQANSTSLRAHCQTSAPAPGGSMGVPLVRLRELRLEGASLHNRDTGRRDCKRKSRPGEGEPERELVDELVEWAALRCDHGIPLWKLRLRRCDSVTEKDVDRVRKVVREVDWERWERWERGAAVGPPKWVDRARDDYKYGGWY